MTIPVDTGRKLNVHKTFNFRPVSTEITVHDGVKATILLITKE